MTVFNAVTTCNDCGSIFARRSSDKCPACHRQDMLLLAQTSQYLASHPEATLEELIAKTGASEEKFLRLIRQGDFRRLEIPLKYPCRICNSRIDSGVICKKCSEQLNVQISQLKESIWGEAQIRRRIEIDDVFTRDSENPEVNEATLKLYSGGIFDKRSSSTGRSGSRKIGKTKTSKGWWSF